MLLTEGATITALVERDHTAAHKARTGPAAHNVRLEMSQHYDTLKLTSQGERAAQL
jgi:hypothetical protein